MYMFDNYKLMPAWATSCANDADMRKIRGMLKDRGDAAGKRAHIEKFTYNIGDWFGGINNTLQNEENYCLFEYPGKSKMAGSFRVIKT